METDNSAFTSQIHEIVFLAEPAMRAVPGTASSAGCWDLR
jgi:hypothetical protein